MSEFSPGALQELLDYIEAEAVPYLPELEEGDLTRKRYAEHRGITQRAAGYQLDALVRQGKLKQINKRDPHGFTIATYQKPCR